MSIDATAPGSVYTVERHTKRVLVALAADGRGGVTSGQGLVKGAQPPINQPPILTEFTIDAST
jgi:hypothetical protein